MNLQDALARGVSAAKSQFNPAADKLAEAQQAIYNLENFAKSYIVPALNASGDKSFACYSGERLNGQERYVNVVERSYPHRSAEFTANTKTGDLRVEVNPTSAMSVGSYSRNGLTEDVAFETMAEWAANANPEAVNELSVTAQDFTVTLG